MSEHWRNRADVDGGPRHLGEDENGVLWVPSRTHEGWWDRRLRLWNPTHWPAYLRSRREYSVAFIETGAAR